MSVALTNLDRVLWPETGFTKGDLVAYYRAVAPVLLPHLERRPLTLWRFPSGVHRRGWWQNECRGAPEWLATAELRGQRFCVVDDAASLVWVANQGTVELHPFPLRLDAPEQAARLLLDLDPGPPATILDCCDVALAARDLVGSGVLVKTSGSAGLHVVVPLPRPLPLAEAKTQARELAGRLAESLPERIVVEQRRAARAGKVLVDWLQNDATRTTVAPYSLRATRTPSVSTPLRWEEVERAAMERRPELLRVTPAGALARLERDGDLWSAVARL